MSFGRPREFDEDVALDQAIVTFWRYGYDGASLSDLTTAMGMNKSSVYAVFGSKEDLFLRALDRYSKRDLAYVGAATTQPTALAVATAYLRDNADALTREGLPPGCLALQGGLSCSPANVEIVAVLARQRLRSERQLTRRFQRARRDGDLSADAKPTVLSRFLTSVAQGHAVHAVGGATREQLHESVEIALTAFRSLALPVRRSR